jgi:hypothetical protein
LFAFSAIPCTLGNCTPDHIRLSDGPIHYPTSKIGGEPRPPGYSKARKFESKAACDRAKWKRVVIYRDGFKLEMESQKAASIYLGCTGSCVSMAIRRRGTISGRDCLHYSVAFA